jgi:Amt family ammonium transporter
VPIEQSLNLAWVVLAAFLVMFMQAGFALVETGFTRARNAANTIAMNLVIYPVGVLGFWAVGYGLMYGGVSAWPGLPGGGPAHELGFTVGGQLVGLLGAAKFALVSVAGDPANLAIFLFATVFMDTAATIPTGAMAERWRFMAFLLYGLAMSMLIYPLYGHWVWGGGWLSQLGVLLGLGHGQVDFAGSSVVHLTGGVTGLVGTLALGPRQGKFRADGTIGAMPGHNLPMSVLGTLILAFGWFGFNAGSTLGVAGEGGARVALIAVNTMLASSAGLVAALLWVWAEVRKFDVGMACNGLLAGLVAITGPCAFVSPAAAVFIGVVAGLAVVLAVGLMERRLRIDDPVGAVAVHGVGGAWGALAVGIFADGSYGAGWNGVAGGVRGLLFGDAGQLLAQVIGVLVNLLVVGGLAFATFRLTGRLVGNRVPIEVEYTGLDQLEMGADAYPRT